VSTRLHNVSQKTVLLTKFCSLQNSSSFNCPVIGEVTLLSVQV
jgi:hypothetical protein